MSMDMLSIYQFLQMLIAYLLVTMLVPGIVFWKRLEGRGIAEKILSCFTIGNFYIMNLVLVLGVCHLLYKPLVLGIYVVTSFFAWKWLNHIRFAETVYDLVHIWKLRAERKIGNKYLLYKGWKAVSTGFRRIAGRVIRICRSNATILLLSVVFLGLLLRIYGSKLIAIYGFTASDIPVHMYWLNGLEENHIFIAGVYPFGFHCVIYFLHALFGFDVYVLMRSFFLVQVIIIHFTMVLFLYLLLRNKAMTFAPLFGYVLIVLIAEKTYYRYYSTLPQEYGMIYILPGLCYLLLFLREHYHKESSKKLDRYLLWMFAMNLSMSFAVHFYDTMVLGLILIGAAFGYWFMAIRKEILIPVLLYGMLGFMLAVLPMGVAFATGTPLQGSIGWGMNIINGTQKGASMEAQADAIEQMAAASVQSLGEDDSSSMEDVVTSDLESVDQEDEVKAKPSFKQRMIHVYQRIIVYLAAMSEEPNFAVARTIFYLPWIMIGIGAFVLLLRKGGGWYGGLISSAGFGLLFLEMLYCADVLGFPRLMDAGRTSIYLAFFLAICAGILLDAGLFFLSRFTHLSHLIGVLLALFVLWVSISGHIVKPLMEYTYDGYQTNGAVTAFTNIIKNERPYRWTIVSINDETQMVNGHGYHYETIDFLRKQEDVGESGFIKIPTEKVFLFIEKRPVKYRENYEEEGEWIAAKYARYELSKSTGSAAQVGLNRLILMSRMDFWAKKFAKLYPNDINVYLETDDFICYEITQNPYRLTNLAIDYGFNTGRHLRNFHDGERNES